MTQSSWPDLTRDQKAWESAKAANPNASFSVIAQQAQAIKCADAKGESDVERERRR